MCSVVTIDAERMAVLNHPCHVRKRRVVDERATGFGIVEIMLRSSNKSVHMDGSVNLRKLHSPESCQDELPSRNRWQAKCDAHWIRSEGGAGSRIPLGHQGRRSGVPPQWVSGAAWYIHAVLPAIIETNGKVAQIVQAG